MSHDPDHILPTENYTVFQFIQTFNNIENSAERIGLHEATIGAANFALTGRHPTRLTQAVVNPLTNRMPARAVPVVRRDYDSLIGLTNHIPVVCPLYVYPVAKLEDTLKSNLHVKFPFPIFAGNPDVLMPAHKIPNMLLAHFGQRHMLRIFFPGLYNEERAHVELTIEERRTVYEKGIRIAATRTNPTAVGDWPVTFDDEVFRARNHQRGFSWGSKLVAACDIVDFSRNLEDALGGVDWARDIRFMTQIRGVKLGNYHDPTPDAATDGLAEFTEDVMTHEGIWYVDVGLEVSEEGYAYQWATDSHTVLVMDVLGVTEVEALRLTRPGRRYARDLSSHFLDLSGFRTTTDGYSGPHGIEYVQCYTVDKTVTYHPDQRGHSSKYITTDMAIKGDPPAFTQNLLNVYSNAAQHNDCAARLEVRLPIANATRVLLGLERDLMEQSIVRFRRNVWWGWRSIRLAAAGTTLGIQNSSPQQTRTKYSALLLTAGLVWFINGLHSRPDDGGSCDELKCAIFPNTDDINHRNVVVSRHYDRNRRDGSAGLPYCPGGVFFFRRLYWPLDSSTPRLGEGRLISRKAWFYFFKKDEATIRQKLYPVGFSSNIRNPARVPIRKGRTLISANPPPEQPVFADLAELEIVGAVEVANDVPLERQIEGYDDENAADIVGRLWLQSFSDMLQKISAPKGKPYAPSWSHLDMKAREYAKPDIFESNNLGAVFTSVMWRRAAREDWNDTFAILWPDVADVRPIKSAQWPNLRYFREWKEFIGTLPRDQVTQIRKSLKKKFNDLYWVPAATRGKLWDYKKDRKFEALPKKSDRGPHVLVNYRKIERPTFELPLVFEEEEEEEEEEEDRVEPPPTFGRRERDEEEEEEGDDEDEDEGNRGNVNDWAELFGSEDDGERQEDEEWDDVQRELERDGSRNASVQRVNSVVGSEEDDDELSNEDVGEGSD